MTMLIPVILSGGAGTRLWPASRRLHPKPFLRLDDGETLLQKTVARARRVAPDAPILTVTSQDHYFLTRDLYDAEPLAGDCRFLLEPVARNTAPAVLAAALWAQAQIGPEARLLVLPADHLIEDLAGFADAVQAAETLAAAGQLVTFGVQPTRPETGYGYIQRGAAMEGGFRIDRFVEKPDLATAEAYLASGEYYWNSGMFCFPVEALLAEAASSCPDVLAPLRACWETTAKAEPCRLDRDGFAAVPSISIDYAVMERAQARAVVPARFDWNDIGSWESLGTLGEGDAQGNRISGPAVLVASRNCYVRSTGRTIAAVGVEDLCIVDEGDAVLVTHRDHSQSVKQVVDQLREAGHAAVDVHQTVRRPWGSYTVLEDADDCKVKRLVVKPGQILSLQRHQRRSEHWTVVRGTARVRVGEETFDLQVNQSTYIPAGTLHRLENCTDQDTHLIEVQCGDYFGEDDIERFEDRYGRV
ncbi:MAG: mannose-1-phosphate guanylyltransferase/mannose-6-phosphate isomerase [Lysobacterales bacterium]